MQLEHISTLEATLSLAKSSESERIREFENQIEILIKEKKRNQEIFIEQKKSLEQTIMQLSTENMIKEQKINELFPQKIQKLGFIFFISLFKFNFKEFSKKKL